VIGTDGIGRIASKHQMRNHHRMRTTLDIDDDVLAAAKSLARHRGCTLGEMISSLVRSAINPPERPRPGVAEPTPFYGFEAFPAEGKVVTNEQIDDLRDREGI